MKTILFVLSNLILCECSAQTLTHHVSGNDRVIQVTVSEHIHKDTKRLIHVGCPDLLRLFPEPTKQTFAFEGDHSIIVGVLLEDLIFVYGRDTVEPLGHHFRFYASWFDRNGREITPLMALKNPQPELVPRMRVTTTLSNAGRLSNEGGFGFYCYSMKGSRPDNAVYLKIVSEKEKGWNQSSKPQTVTAHYIPLCELKPPVSELRKDELK